MRGHSPVASIRSGVPRFLALIAALFFLAYHTPAAAFEIIERSTNGDFYISTKFPTNNIGGMYVAYAINNDTGIAYDDVWVQIDSFTGGVVGLATNEDGRQQLGPMAAGQTTMAYIFLGATTDTTSPQGHTVRLYDGRPGLPGVSELDNATFSFTGVQTSIAASANKVDIVVSGPDPATIGGIVTVQVEGRTGTVGAGSNLELTPAGDLSWPADTFQLVETGVTLYDIQGSNCSSTVLGSFSDQLEIVWGQTSCYVALYKFAATNTTSQPTSVSPIIHVASGTQIKHTDTGGFAALPPISPPQNALTLSKSASPTTLSSGGTATYTLTLTNTASNATCPVAAPTCNDLVVQEFEDTLPTTPAAVTYQLGTSSFEGSSISDPVQSANVMTWIGAFTVPAGGTAALTYDVTIPATDGSYVNSAVGKIGPFQIDTTIDATDVPATATVTVGTESPSLGVSKDASFTGTGPFAVTLDFYLENFGNVALSSVQVTDDLDTAFGAGNYSLTSGPTIVSDPGGGLTVNPSFNGGTDQNLLGSSSLGTSQTAQLQLVISVTNPGSYTNSAAAGGDPPSGPGNRVSDDSVDGTDPDANNNGDPGDDTGDTPIDLAENASLGIAKDASFTGAGPFAVTLDFYLENFGNVALSNLQVTDDLDTAFGAGNYSLTSGPTIVSDPGGGLTVNSGFNGGTDQSLLVAGSSSLGTSQTAQLQLVVSVTSPGSYTNSAIAGGDPPSGAGNRVTDDSVDGTDPDANNNGDPGDDMGDTPIDLAENASLGIAKDASFTGTGPFAVTLDFYLENFGNVALSSVQVTDDLDTAFGAGNYSVTSGPTIVSDPGGGLTVNPSFNGGTDQNLLGSSSLGTSQTAQLQLVISVTNPGSYTNSGVAGGDPPSGAGNRVTDDSVDGTDPDANNNGDPGDDAGDTPIDLAENASLGIAKDASFTGAGPFAVTLDFYLENFGNVALSNAQVTDDLDTAFGAGNYSVTSGPTIVVDPGGGLTVNAGFNGGTDQDLLVTGSSSLGTSQTAQLQLVVSVTSPGSYTNSAIAGGDPPSGPGNRVNDDSVDGTDPDANNNGDPGDDAGDTPIDLAENASLGIAKDASFTGAGPFAVTLDFYLENFGNVALSSVQVTDDLDTAFGAGNYSLTSGPTIVSDPGGGLTVNAGFNGGTDQSLLVAGSSSLATSQTAQLQLVISVTSPGSYTNSAIAGGDPPSGPGNRVTDDSVDGTDPDANNNGDPGDDAGDTPIDLAENASLGIAKDASFTGAGPFAVTLDFYLKNFGNVALSSVQVTDDLDTAFGAGNYSVTSGPTIVSDPGGGLTVNAGFNGGTDQNLLGSSSLGTSQTAQLQLVISVTNPGSYTNSAAAGGDPPSGPGNRVSDDSVDGTDPDANNNGDPGDDTGDTPIDLAENASLGIAKDASFTGAGPFAVTLDFYLENFGNVALSNLQVTDDLDTAFGAGNYSLTSGPTIVSDPGGGLTVNSGFNGGTDQSLLVAGSSSLGTSQTAQLQLVVSVTSPGSYTNSAIAGGDPPSGAGNRVTDDSVDGTDPDANNNGDPGDDMGDTPIDLAENASLGIAKDASFTGTGPFAVTLDFYLENFGNVALSSVQVTDDLDTAFGAGNYSVTSGPTIVSDPGGGLTVNAGFNGGTDQDLLGSSSLGTSQTAQLQLVVSVTSPGSYTNSAIAGGDPPSGPGNRVTDDSVDGTDPDANNNGDPGDDTGDTPIDLAENASLGIAKDASFTGAGPFAVTLDFYLENFGNVALNNVQVTDDLDTAFGAGNYSVTSGPTIVSDPGGGLTVNAGFNGGIDQNLLGSSSLGTSQTAQLQLVISVTNPGSYTNSAIAGGDPPSGPGNRVNDDSVDGTDPDANNNGDPGDDAGDTPIDLAENASLGIAKDASFTGAGPFAVTLDFYLENFGNVALSSVQVTDDLDTAFGAGNYSLTSGPTIVSDPGGGLTVNAGFNGGIDQNLLVAGSSSLATSQTAQLQLVVSVTSPGSYTNSAIAGGDPPSGPGNRVNDDSVDGTDPDANNNGDPGDDMGDTPIDLAENASLGIAKDASFTGAGPFAVTLDFYLENFGNVALSNVQVTDDLDAAFGAGNYSVTSGPTIVSDPGGGLTVNAGFNGGTDQNLLGSSSLGTSQTAQLQLVVSVTNPGSYTNSAIAGGDPPSGAGNRVTDDSVDGTDPDANNNDDPSDDTGDTPIDLAENASLGIAKDASFTGAGPFAVTLDFYLENFGNVALSNVQVTDDLDAAFGAGNYSVTSGPTIVSDPGGGLTVNAGFNGGTDQSLLGSSSFGTSQTAQLQLVVSVTSPGSYTNSAVAAGDPPSGPGNRVADDSVDGTDPDANNNGDPGDDTGDTPIDLGENPSIGIAKDVSFTGAGPFAVTLDFYLENFGNVALSNVQVTDDLDAAFGAGNYSVTSGPTIVSDPGGGLTVNAGFNGGTDQNLLGTSSLGTSQTAQLQLVVSVTSPGSFTNSAVAAGDPPSGPGNRVTDDSVDGADPDANNNGDPGDDTGDTPIDLAENASLGIAKDASFTGTGPFAVTLDFYLENFGNVALSNLQVTDDLDTAFGAGNYSVTSGPTIVSDPGGSLTVNAGFNGGTDQDLLGNSSLGAGQTAQLRLVISIINPGSYTNSAVAAGDPPSGPANRVTDGSVNGVDPDLDGNGNPGDDTGGTPITPGASGTVFVTKSAEPTQATVGGLVSYSVAMENTGSTAITDAIVEDQTPAGFKFVEGSAVLIQLGPDGIQGTADDVESAVTPSVLTPLTLDGIDLAVGETLVLSYLLRVGNGVVDGDYVNTVGVVDLGGAPLGEAASAVVTIVQDSLFDRTGILGKVFHDRDGDGWQDSATASEIVVDFTAAASSLDLAAVRVDSEGSGSHTTDAGLVRLEDMAGCSNASQCSAETVVRLPLVGDLSGPIEIRTGEGSTVRIDRDGSVALLPARGAARRGTTSQALVVDSHIVTVSGRRYLAISIANRGMDEPGIPGVRLVTVVGLRVETDAHGRYHLVDIDGGRLERGRNFILKVDPSTLPPGAEFTTENPRVLRITRALHNRIDFGVRLSRAAVAASGVEPGAEDSVVVELPGIGSVWFTEDPLVAQSRLNIEGPAVVAVENGRLSAPVRFDATANYDAFIERWELAIRFADDTDAAPLATVRGDGEIGGRVITWDGAVTEPLDDGRQLSFSLRVYDGHGNYDETGSKLIALTDPAHLPQTDAERKPFVDDLVRRTIPIRGSRIRILAEGIESASELTIDGKPMAMIDGDTFAGELLLPPGSHELELNLLQPDGTSWSHPVSLDVRGYYMLLVGIADLTIGQTDLGGGIQPIDADDHYDGDVFADGRIAMSLKGKIKGRYLLTAQLDTGEAGLVDLLDNLGDEDPRSVFRHLDPDRYYPVYGDDSTTLEDAPSQGRFFVGLDWDKSSALWGNFNTGFTGTEFAQYNRSLYGAQLQYRSKSTTGFGEDRAQVSAFASPTQTAFSHNQFQATGGSLYYLRDTDIVQGSVKVSIEVQDRDSGRVVSTGTLRRGRDYEVDELQGRILLARPLSQIADQLAPSIIRDVPLGGDPVFLLVDYEYRTATLDEDLSAGARAKGWLGDQLALGGTYVSESRTGQDYELREADVTFRHDAGTYVKVEYAESEATQAAGWFSADGGLSFQPGGATAATSRAGDAIAVEGRMRIAEIMDTERDAEIAVWWKDRSAGFSTARTDDGIATTEYGAEAIWNTGERVDFAARFAVVERSGVAKQESAAVQARIDISERLDLSVEGRHEEQDPAAGPDGSAILAGARVDYHVGPQLSVFGTAQTTVERDGAYQANDLATVGGRLGISDDLALRAEASVGDRGDALLIGGDYRIDDKNTLYGTYTLSVDRTDAQRNAFVLGHRSRLSNQLNLFVENQFAHQLREASFGHVIGLDYRDTAGWVGGLSVQDSSLELSGLSDQQRQVYSVWFGRGATTIDWKVKLEVRTDDGLQRSRQWLTSNRFDYRPGPSLHVFGMLNLSRTDGDPGSLTEAQFVEGTLATAYRPVDNDRWNVLGRYTYLNDLPSAGQRPLRRDQRSHVFSVDALRRLGHRWDLEGKLAYRNSEIRAGRDQGPWFTADARLVVLRSRYHIVSRWDGIAELRKLWSEDADDARQGLLLGVDRHVGDHLRVGVGYNFTDFTDDLTRFDYDGSGWFLNVVGKY